MLRVIAEPFRSNPQKWPKADSGKVSIFEAINIVGQAIYAEAWSGTELQARWWSVNFEAQQIESREARLRQIEKITRPPSDIDRRRAIQLGRDPRENHDMHVRERQRTNALADLARDDGAWNENREKFERLEMAAERLAQLCRDSCLSGYLRSAHGGRLMAMDASAWNVENPLGRFLVNGGPKDSFSHHFIFFDKLSLLAILDRPRNPNEAIEHFNAVQNWAADAASRGVTVSDARKDAREKLGKLAPPQDDCRQALRLARAAIGSPVELGRPLGKKTQREK